MLCLAVASTVMNQVFSSDWKIRYNQHKEMLNIIT